MPTSVAQRSFAGGEIAPELAGRADQAKYQTGLARCRNFLVQRFGGITNRPGTTFLAKTHYNHITGLTGSRLLRFLASSTSNYILELGDFTMRVVKFGQVLTIAPAAWSSGTTYALGDTVSVSGVNYWSKVAGNLNNTPASSPTKWYAIPTSSVAGALVVPTPWAIAHVRDLQLAQSADVMTIVHPNYPPYEIRRYGDTKWGIALAAFAPSIAAPASCSATRGAAGSNTYRYRVTAISPTNSEESLPALETGKTVTGATQANPCQLTVVAHGYSNGDEITISGIVGMTQLNGQTVTLTSTGANTFTLNSIDSTAYTAYSSGGSVARTFARIDSAATPSSGSPNVLTWTQVTGAQAYNIYRETNGLYGFIGTAIGLTFSDINYGPVTTYTPPTARNPYASANNYPSVVAYFQQRLVFGNTIINPETIEASRIGRYNNFTKSIPTQADDAITWTMAGREVAPVRHLLEVGNLIVLTDSSEWTVRGDVDGNLKPTAINPRQEGFTGASSVPPVIIQNSALFVQSRGAIIRDLRYDYDVQGYHGRDLTVYAPHLFDGYGIVSLTYAANPHSIVWVVRSDGVLLGLTYLREHEVWGWHWHDTDGKFLDAAAVPEITDDGLYALTSRVVGGGTVEYLERVNSRNVTDVAVDAHFVDCGITVDGRNTTATTFTLSGGTTWAFSETLTLTASTSQFTVGSVGAIYRLTGADGDFITFTITGYTSGTVVTGTTNKTVPAGLQNVAVTAWALCRSIITGLSHLEGKTVAILADGDVVPSQVVTGGQITLPRAYVITHAGLSYLAQAQLLNYEDTQGETLIDKMKLVGRVSLLVKATRGLWAGLDTMREAKPPAVTNYNKAIPPVTATIDVLVDSSWRRSAQVVIEQRDPLPATILAVTARTEAGGT